MGDASCELVVVDEIDGDRLCEEDEEASVVEERE